LTTDFFRTFDSHRPHRKAVKKRGSTRMEHRSTPIHTQ